MPFSAMSASVCGGIGAKCRVERLPGPPQAVSMSASAAATRAGFATMTPYGPPSWTPSACIITVRLTHGLPAGKSIMLGVDLGCGRPRDHHVIRNVELKGRPATAGGLRTSVARDRLAASKTCREFNSAPLPSDLVDALLRVAFSASSKSDYQQASLIRVEERPEMSVKVTPRTSR
jgi:hypothetical protein